MYTTEPPRRVSQELVCKRGLGKTCLTLCMSLAPSWWIYPHRSLQCLGAIGMDHGLAPVVLDHGTLHSSTLALHANVSAGCSAQSIHYRTALWGLGMVPKVCLSQLKEVTKHSEKILGKSS